MSTEIKNTLFRFVSMRAPELSDENKQEEKFIFRNENVPTGVFDAVVGKTSKWQELQIIANDFIPLTLKEIKELDQKLTQLSVWVAKNRLSYKKEDLIKYTEGVEAINDTEILGQLWDNLFYQTVTQKDFYAKETLIQLLIANHFVSKYRVDDPELTKKLLNAKVVLPKDLFVENDNQAPVLKTINNSVSRISKTASSSARKLLLIEETSIKNEKLTQLSKELKVAKKAHQKEFEAALRLAQDNHEKLIKPILDQYAIDVEAEKQRWCSLRDPGTPYDPNNPCDQIPKIPEPELPPFNFEFREELDVDYLRLKLSPEGFETLLEVTNLTEEDLNPSKSLDEPTNFSTNFNSFDELENEISNNVNTNNQTIAINTEVNQNILVSIGGMLTPVTSSTNYFDYEFGTVPFLTGKYRSYLSFEVPDNTWQIDSFNYTVERETSDYSNNSNPSAYSIKRIGNKITLMRIDIESPTLNDLANYIAFEGEITFTNGSKKLIEVNPFTLGNIVYGSLSDNDIENDNSNGQTGINNFAAPFIPSGFGVKQLGIADYNKVEQSTLGYIEGEVAHIENIMAREFKEKSTRKLRKTENTFTSSSESEKENLSDTTSTNRFDMQNEVAKVIQQSKDFSAGAYFDVNLVKARFGGNVNFATHNSKEESTRQAVTEAQEITERALDRMVTKVKEERIEKIVDEFEENNSHGFDNRKGDKHVVGVFRWVDKVFKNQIVNYGKRLMFEFMVPQPAKLHILGMSENEQIGKIVEPIDPRNSEDYNLKDYSQIDGTKLKYWASKYNIEIEPKPEEKINISISFSEQNLGINDNGYGRWTGVYNFNDFKVPENYQATKVKGNINVGRGQYHSGVYVTSHVYVCGNEVGSNVNLVLDKKVKDIISISGVFWDVKAISGTLVAECELTDEAYAIWQQKCFKAIISAYEKALVAHNEKIAAEMTTGIQIKGTNPGFYREFENKILRKNCISYMIDQNPNAKNTYGKNNLFTTNILNVTPSFGNTEVNVSQELDNYSSFVKFMEQAFEWDIMSYNLYPYYWGNRADWAALYQYDESNDPLFRNFMQAGMARVVVTVRPGFEEAVRHYMQTGQIWNGGEVPVIEDELYLSIVDELTAVKGEKLGGAWATRVPTALTILQAQSIGLNVTKALPFDDDLSDFESPEDVPQSSAFELTEAELGGSNTTKTARLVGSIEGNQGIESKILLKRIDGTIQDITYCDTEGKWELNHLPAGKYELFLDANDDFSEGTFIVIQGSKEQVVELEDDQLIEIQLVVKKL